MLCATLLLQPELAHPCAHPHACNTPLKPPTALIGLHHKQGPRNAAGTRQGRHWCEQVAEDLEWQPGLQPAGGHPGRVGAKTTGDMSWALRAPHAVAGLSGQRVCVCVCVCVYNAMLNAVNAAACNMSDDRTRASPIPMVRAFEGLRPGWHREQ